MSRTSGRSVGSVGSRRIGPTFQEWHFVEARPQERCSTNRDARQAIDQKKERRAVSRSKREAETTSTIIRTTVLRPRKLSADGPADAVDTKGATGPRTEFGGEASVEGPIATSSDHREAIDHDRCVRLGSFTKLPRNPGGVVSVCFPFPWCLCPVRRCPIKVESATSADL